MLICTKVKYSVKARFHYERGKKHSLFVLLLFFCARFNFNRSLQSKINKRDKECSFPLPAWKRAFFVSFIDLRLKRAVKIEASAKKKQYNKQRMLFSTLIVETGL